MTSLQRTAIGFRAHTGWAAVVVLAGPLDAPRVIDRRRIELTSETELARIQIYHTAAEQPIARAKAMIDAARTATHATASTAISTLIATAHPSRAGIVAGNAPLPVALESILASHALIHSAEGELYRAAIVAACGARALAITGFASKTLYERGAKLLAMPVAKLRRQIGELGKGLGPPWAQDQKESALVAWMALALE